MGDAESDYCIKKVETEVDKEQFIHTWHCSWIEQGYVEPGEDAIFNKYAIYDSYSDDFLLLKCNKPIGTLRIIRTNEKVGIPVRNDFEIESEVPSNMCEATLLTVIPSERVSQEPALALLTHLWKYVRVNNIRGIGIAADVRLWFFLTRVLSLCFTKIGAEKMYEGSLTIPGYLDVEEQKAIAMTQLVSRNILEAAMKAV